jgi:hypothetical protein
MLIKTSLDKKGNEWQHFYFGLEETKENKKTINYYLENLTNLWDNEKYVPRVLDFLENSKYNLNIEERECGNNLQFIKLKENYFDSSRGVLGTPNKNRRKVLDIIIYEKVDLEYSKNLAIKNLTATIKGDLSLGDRKIIKDIALENFYSNLEKAISRDYSEVWNLLSVVRLDLHSAPKMQLSNYGFEVQHPWIKEIKIIENSENYFGHYKKKFE